MSRPGGAVFGLAVAAVSGLALAAPQALAPLVGEGAAPPVPWRVAGLPGQTLPLTQFAVTTVDGERALQVRAEGSYGNLVHALSGPAANHRQLRWRWRLDQALAEADLQARHGDDAALKVCALFDLPLDALPFLERQKLRLARSVSGEHLPAATLCYVWDRRLAPGTVLPNVYSARLRWWVLRGPADPLARWAGEERDLAADFQRAFGDESATVPPLLAIAVGADADNTGGRSLGWVADLVLAP